jgi:hypothetical protein
MDELLVDEIIGHESDATAVTPEQAAEINSLEN